MYLVLNEHSAKRRLRLALFFIALLITLPEPGYAALASVSRFARLDIQQGLSQATVTALAQDSAGNIWIGTQNGLNRYDGFAVTVFRPDPELNHSLSDNFVTALQVDQHGVIWVGTLNGLNRFDPRLGYFESIQAQTPDNTETVVLSLHLDAQQQLWVGTNIGLALWHAPTQALQWPLPDNAGNIELQNNNISAISTDADGQLWLGTPRGLVRFNPDSGKLSKVADFPFPTASVMALHHDTAGRLWVGLEHEGLVLLDPVSGGWTKITLTSYSSGVNSSEIRSIKMTRDGQLWVGSQYGLSSLRLIEGLWQQHASYYHQRHNPASLGNGKVVSLLEDRDGSIWVGTWNGGVSRLNQANNLFSSITPDLPLMAAVRNPATISLISDDERLWAGTADGLFQLNIRDNRLDAVAAESHRLTFYCAIAHNNQLWFGHAQGISTLDIQSGDYRDQPLPAAVSTGPVRRLWASDTQLWLAIEQFGIVILDHTAQQLIAQYPFNRAITFIRPLGQRYVLVGSYSGLSWFDRQSGELIFEHQLKANAASTATSLPSAPMAYLSDANGQHWLATNGTGLLQLLPQGYDITPASVSFKQYAEPQGLANGQLKAAELDLQGNIWLSSAFGISVFEPATTRFRNFGFRHGTLRRDYINASSTRFADGSIAFGGMDGFTLFQPQQVLAYTPQPIAAPTLVSLTVNGAAARLNNDSREASLARIVHQLKKLTIPATGSRSFSASYSSREFIETELVQFQYRLDPVSTDWITQDASNRNARFERLPPGQYKLRLRAGLPQLGWSEETVLEVEVLPLWWETWWARLLLFSILPSILLGLHLTRLKRLKKQQEELAWLVEARTEQLSDRTRALQESKNKAEQTLQQLESTMKELVRTEKMAALGQLVAGVAHEVNTPLGVALTANSVVTEESLLLQQKLASGNIRRQELTDYLYKLTQAGRLLDHNLQRAAQLVANFKQVSVDRTADNQRQFKLALYLDELLESLSLMWRSRQIIFIVNCPDDIEMDSYPGTIGQIITNLTQNAIVHGFKDRSSGQISLSCLNKANTIEIIFADNGSGISSENLERIFDPFFTTNRHQGGTGLGLHIVFNLITQKLGGTITVASTPGAGTCFTLLLPRRVTPR
ncbi:ATP-binding protein [Rheinheimera muenzenbergensis]|uniref:histidine kinase n=1 Tax=Rheinheimera muenzenbergensis TaxID=1193628 RepID=A0ABU8C9Y1_9GAMM